MILFAHTGHWIESVVYVVPVLVLVAWLSIAALRDRRRDRSGGG